MDPSFHHINEDEIPSWQEGNLSYKLIESEPLGRKSPVPVYSKLYFIEIKSKNRARVKIGAELFGESALYILEGSVIEGEHIYEPKQILIAKDTSLCEFEMAENTTIYIFGVEAYLEEIIIYWNLVDKSMYMIELSIK